VYVFSSVCVNHNTPVWVYCGPVCYADVSLIPANRYDEIEQLQDTTNENCLWAVVKCWFDGEGETVGQKPSWRWLIWKLDDGNL